MDIPPIELLEGRQAEVGGNVVVRLLPKRTHRTVGPWCFVDHFGPADVADAPMAVGPHPHTGLQTVTWLLEGEALHTDSIGSEQLIRPGQLNLMSAGRGIAHAEQSPGDAAGDLHGVQLWVAQPEATRHGPPAFEHHASLPRVALGSAVATVLVGSLSSATSPARADWPSLGADVLVMGTTEIPLDPTFEHAVFVVDAAGSTGGTVALDGEQLPLDAIAYLAAGRASVSVSGTGRVMVVGGLPFESTILMWWNFVTRTPAEMDQAYDDWAADTERFGTVRSKLDRTSAPERRTIA